MTEEKDLKEKIKKIYEVLPKLDDQRCGFKTCGAFAKAVAEGKAPCYGCVTGGPEVAAKVCEIMGASIPASAQAPPSVGPFPGFYRAGFSGGWGMAMNGGRGRGLGRGLPGGRRMGWGRRMGHGRWGR